MKRLVSCRLTAEALTCILQGLGMIPEKALVLTGDWDHSRCLLSLVVSSDKAPEIPEGDPLPELPIEAVADGQALAAKFENWAQKLRLSEKGKELLWAIQ